MKQKIILFLVFPIVLQSCFSYRTIDANKDKFKEGKSYQIILSNKSEKGTLLAQNDSVLNFKIKNNEKQVNKNQITEIKVKKFSVLKTIGLFTGIIVVGTTIGVVISFNNFNPKPLNSFPQ